MKTISEQRIKDCLEILNKEERGEIVKERLERLSCQLLHLLDEIEEFRRVVYCKRAAACRLDNNVLKILSGSIHRSGKPLEKDVYLAVLTVGKSGKINQANQWVGHSKTKI
jgi:hypothetical protein